jgi:hypothetical protein
LADLVIDKSELGCAENKKASVLAAGDHEAALELFAEFGRENDATLFIQLW